MESPGEHTSYAVPTYQPSPEDCWYHFLHGNVPGHEIDFIYRPEVPQGPLTRQHFSHLARLVRYIEPWSRSAHAFAIGNLSRDDTQYEPGRGAVALIFGLRIRGAKDHAGRRDPPFCHAIAAVDRHLDEANLLDSALELHRRLSPDEGSEAEGSGWYHSYARHAQDPDALRPLLQTYVAGFEDLPAPRASELGLRWTAGDAMPPKRVVIVHDESEPFESIAACAARIAGVLVESDIRWTVISNGREPDLPGGVSVRFVPTQDAGEEEAGVRVFRREDVPEDPREIAEQLFGAQAVQSSPLAAPRMGWRQRDEKQTAGKSAEAAREGASLQGEAARTRAPAKKKKSAKRSRARVGVLIWLGLPLLIGGIVTALEMRTNGPPRDGMGEPRVAQTLAVVPTENATVSSAQLAETSTAEPEPPVQAGLQGAPSAVALGGEKRLEMGAGRGKTLSGKMSVYDIKVPLALKK